MRPRTVKASVTNAAAAAALSDGGVVGGRYWYECSNTTGGELKPMRQAAARRTTAANAPKAVHTGPAARANGAGWLAYTPVGGGGLPGRL